MNKRALWKKLDAQKGKTLTAASKRYIALYKDWIEPACAGFKGVENRLQNPVKC